MNVLKAEPSFEKHHRLLREVIETIVLTVLMFVIINLAVQNYDVDGPSMEPTLHNGERIMVDKVSYRFHAPQRGDIIVFIAPPNPQEDFVKRIIGVPGDEITVNNTTVTVDGVTLNEPYVAATRQGNPNLIKTNHYILPANRYFVMGDDRINSSDSRSWGLVPRANIIGRAALIYWPLGEDNDGFLQNFSSVFANVHQKTQTSSVSPPHSGTLVSDDTLLFFMPAVFLLSSRYRKKRRKLF